MHTDDAMIVAGERGNVRSQAIVLRLQHRHEAAASRCEECFLAGLLHEHWKPWHSAPFPGTLANLIDGVAYYVESTISPVQEYSTFVRSVRIPSSELGQQTCWASCPWQRGAVCVAHALQKDLQSFHRRVAAPHITHLRYKRSAIVLPRMICSSTVLHGVQKICNLFCMHGLQPDSPALRSKDLQSFCCSVSAS